MRVLTSMRRQLKAATSTPVASTTILRAVCVKTVTSVARRNSPSCTPVIRPDATLDQIEHVIPVQVAERDVGHRQMPDHDAQAQVAAAPGQEATRPGEGGLRAALNRFAG